MLRLARVFGERRGAFRELLGEINQHSLGAGIAQFAERPQQPQFEQ
jgi:hypothetical protein